MSGFVGWFDFQRDLDNHNHRSTLQTMTNTMQQRGPGGTGLWTSKNAGLGYCGLLAEGLPSIAQPALLSTNQGEIAAVFDGYINNIFELKQSLEKLGNDVTTSSPAKLLLQAFLVWGESFVDRLNGTFALAVWDGRSQQALLVRDRMGVKPLYYFAYSNGIVFASEPKGIIANSLFEPRLNFSSLPILLQPRLALPGETPLTNLFEVPPAHMIRYSQKGLLSKRFWQLCSMPHHQSFTETSHHIRDLLTDIISQQLTFDVQYGAMLSGGLDSSSVAALAMLELQKKNTGKSIKTFCVQFERDDTHFVPTELRPDIDAPYAMKVAEFIGSDHKTLVATTEELLAAIPACRQARDLPGWGQFDASMYLLFKAMKRDCATALTGEAADELFGGYPYCFNQKFIQRQHFPWLGDGPKLSDYLSPDLMTRINPQEDERARYAQLVAEVPSLTGEDPKNARMREILYLGMRGPLSVILDRKDRMSMALGLDMRLPFCDHRLVEYVWNVPWSMKSTGGVKGLLKAAMKSILPDSTLNRKKSAYPHVQNPDYDKILIHQATWFANHKCSPIAELFNTPKLNQLIKEITNGGIGHLEKKSLPGGGNAAYMLIQLVEMGQWINDYQVSLS